MDEFLNKEYVMVSEKNLDAYMAFIGIGYLQRKVGVNLRPIQYLVRNEDGTYTFVLKSKMINLSCTFTPGEKFVETRGDGVKLEALITFEGNKMTHIQIEPNGRTSKHVREFYPDKLIVTTTVVGLDKIITRTYHLVQ